MRLLLTILATFAVGALLGLLVGWPFHHAGGWGWWAIGGGAVVFIAAVCWLAWDLTAHGNIIVSWLLAACASVLLANPAPARADLVVRNPQEQAELRLLDAPCSDAAVLARIPPQLLPEFKAARETIRGSANAACWAQPPGAQVLVVWPDGYAVLIERSAFEDSAL